MPIPEPVRALAVSLAAYLAYVAYRCPCDVLYACKPRRFITAATVLAALVYYPALVGAASW